MPTWLVLPERITLVSLWVRRTSAPTITAPEGSVTVPATPPRLVCANADVTRTAIANIRSNTAIEAPLRLLGPRVTNYVCHCSPRQGAETPHLARPIGSPGQISCQAELRV